MASRPGRGPISWILSTGVSISECLGSGRDQLLVALDTTPYSRDIDAAHVGGLDRLHSATTTHLTRALRDTESLYQGAAREVVALVLRRLRRIANHYGSDPVFVCCSATIRNPGELAEALVGGPVEVIADDGSPRGPKTFAFWNPRFLDRNQLERRSANGEAGRLFTELLRRGAQTIAFTAFPSPAAVWRFTNAGEPVPSA